MFSNNAEPVVISVDTIFNALPDGIHASRSIDNGVSWSSVQISTAEPVYFDAAADSTGVSVTWVDDRFGGRGDVFCNSSQDGGQTWQATDTRINTNAAGSISDRDLPNVARDGGGVSVVWRDNRTGSLPGASMEVFSNSSPDGGITWLANDVRLSPPWTGWTSASSIDVHRSGNVVLSCWGIDDPATPLQVSRSADGGVTWQALPIPGGFALEGAGNLVALGSYSPFPRDPYVSYSLDAGLTWTAPARLNSNPMGTADSRYLRLVAQQDRVGAAWYDFRTMVDGPGLYFNRPFGALEVGNGTPGSGAVIPRLSMGGSPVRGGVFSVDADQVGGGATGALFVGFGVASQVSIPFLGGTVLVDPITTVPWVANGVLGVVGDGAASIAFALSTDPALAGLNVNFQGVFLDSGAAMGLSMTNSVRSWIG